MLIVCLRYMRCSNSGSWSRGYESTWSLQSYSLGYNQRKKNRGMMFLWIFYFLIQENTSLKSNLVPRLLCNQKICLFGWAIRVTVAEARIWLESHDLWDQKLLYPRVPPGDQYLAKEPEDSGCDFSLTLKCFMHAHVDSCCPYFVILPLI